MEQWHYFCLISRQSGREPVLRIILRSKLIHTCLKSQHPCEKLSEGSQNSTIASPTAKHWDKRPLWSIINKTGDLSQSKQPSPKLRLHPEVHCCKSMQLISSPPHLNETLMIFHQPQDQWVGFTQANTGELHSGVEGHVEAASPQDHQHVLL